MAIDKSSKSEWQSINPDSNSIISGIADEETAVCINQELVNEVDQFARKCLQEKNEPRADYMELLEPSLIYMGHVPPRGIHLTFSGTMYRT